MGFKGLAGFFTTGCKMKIKYFNASEKRCNEVRVLNTLLRKHGAK
jgi:hypothetical protein